MESSFLSYAQPHLLVSDASIPATPAASSEALWGFQHQDVQSSPSIPQSFSTDPPLNPAQKKKRVTFGPDQIILITPRQTQSLLSCESIPTPTDEEERELPILLPAPPSTVWESQATQDSIHGEGVDVTPCYAQLSPSTNAATVLFSRPTNIFGAAVTSSSTTSISQPPPSNNCLIDWNSVSEDSLGGVTWMPAPTVDAQPRCCDAAPASLPLLESMSSSSTFDASATFAVICGSSSGVVLSNNIALGQPPSTAEAEDDNSMGALPVLTMQRTSTGDISHNASAVEECSAFGYKEPSSQDDASSPLNHSTEGRLVVEHETFASSGQAPAGVDSTLSQEAVMCATQKQCSTSIERSSVNAPAHQLFDASNAHAEDNVCATQNLGDYAAAFLSKHDSMSFGSAPSPPAEDFRTPPRGSNTTTTTSGLSTTRGLPLGPQCVFCSASDASVVLHSGYYLHIACALWCPEVYCDPMTEQLKHISDGVTRGATLRCEHCHHPGATVGCLDDICQRSYHYPCALAAGCAVSPSCVTEENPVPDQAQSVFEPGEKFVMRCPLHATPSATKERRGKKRDRDA
ncbi:Hypothetical protein, putative [Bodo saltans]|uniref:PHD-type domain-containing protein n=1 Tax=Bodo saltans TaxID=75058 RepID=A0A0S4JPQ0_BODSA|nr:Hypothetical protein, putative [Bodo saltans]|eukprot:CUG92663.1 Hypothetical protein, putative [Bodo saltans]